MATPFCTYSMPIDTRLTTNNRTINGTSAVESAYDASFALLTNAMGRGFLAMIRVEMEDGFAVEDGQSWQVGWLALRGESCLPAGGN